MKNRKDYDIELEDDMPLPNDLEIRYVNGTEDNDDDNELTDDIPVPADQEIKEDD